MPEITLTKLVENHTTTRPTGHVEWLQVTRYMDGTREVTRENHRTSLEPGADLAGIPEDVARIARAAWGS